MEDCIFCKIVKGDIPSHKVYEDADTLAFLGITPPVEGFTLVIPKKHSDEIWHMEEDNYSALMDAVYKIGNHYRREFATDRVGLQVEGLEVKHTHVKILPINTAGEFRALEPKEEPDHDKLAKMAQRLRIEE